MTFSSPEFLLFLPVVLTIHWFVLGAFEEVRRSRYRRLFLLAASYYFYMSWNAELALLLLLSTLIDYLAGAWIHATTSPFKRKALLIVSLASNLGLLGVFKYANFFLDNVDSVIKVLGMRSDFAVDVILPVGISFYTFQSMSYTIDVYRDRLEPAGSFSDFALFVSFFPQLVAGPIVRASEFIPQLARRVRLSEVNLRRGVNYLLMGLTKKLLIADWLSTIADPVFASPSAYNPIGIWVGVVAYAVQIYCDFSGYSDMATGSAALFGYSFPDNFNMPYVAKNIAEFWTRWHISLSTWLRDYLYIPLGGNRRGRLMTYRNLLIVMFLGGLWHGARWTFVAWGVLHGLALVLHKEYRRHYPLPVVGSVRLAPIRAGISWLSTMLFVCFTWVLFRSPSFGTAKVFIAKMLLLRTDGAAAAYPMFIVCVLVVVGAHLLGLRRFSPFLQFERPLARAWIETLGYAAVIFLLLLFAPEGTEPFIYFQF